MANESATLKAFVGYAALADNDQFEVAPLGELSPYSLTFVRDPHIYGTGTNTTPETSIKLTAFSFRDLEGELQPLPSAHSTFLLNVSRWIYQQALTGAFTNDPEVFRQALAAQYGDDLQDITVGPMVQQNTIHLPSSLIAYIPYAAVSAQAPPETHLTVVRVRLWFADASFRNEFDEFEILPVSIFDNLNEFFDSAGEVRANVAAVPASNIVERLQARAGTYPVTMSRVIEFDYHDPLVPTNTFPVPWGVVIYGPAGNNIDAIKQALVDWILENSTHSREEWAEIFPDIFTSTEFILTPFWNTYAIPNMTLQAGVYSPLVNLPTALEMAEATTTGTGYTTAHVRENLSVFNMPFKSLALAAVGGPENRDGLSRLEHMLPDLINVSSSHPDFGRMSPGTQQFVLMLERMMQAAETMTESTEVPTGFTRMKRTNAANQEFIYVVRSHDDVQYLMVTAPSLRAVFPDTEQRPLSVTTEGADGLIAMPHGYMGTAYSTRFVAKGGAGGYTYTLKTPATGVFAGHQIDEVTGVYTATFATSGNATVEIEVMDLAGVVTSKTFTLHVIA